jgi:hypothetical protein
MPSKVDRIVKVGLFLVGLFMVGVIIESCVNRLSMRVDTAEKTERDSLGRVK